MTLKNKTLPYYFRTPSQNEDQLEFQERLRVFTLTMVLFILLSTLSASWQFQAVVDWQILLIIALFNTFVLKPQEDKPVGILLQDMNHLSVEN
jgi:hypothetical protein